MLSRVARSLCAAVLLAPLSMVAIGCEGSGSELGPRLRPIRDADYRVRVASDSGEPVVGAVVALGGTPGRAATGPLGTGRVPKRYPGIRVVTVDGSAGSVAAGGSRFGTVAFLADVQANALDRLVHLPDLSTSTGADVATGPFGGGVLVDDSGTVTKAVLTLAAGTQIGHGTASSVRVRTGALAAHHLPTPLPMAAAARLPGAGVMIDPVDVEFEPAATISLPNDVGLPANAQVELFRLDPTAGTWGVVATAQVDSGGTRIEAAGVLGGGLYAVGGAVSTATTLRGRVLDLDERAVPDAYVRCGGLSTRTDGGGRFVLGPLATTDASGGVRSVLLDIVGGADWYPVRSTQVVALQAGDQSVPDVELETFPVRDVRTLQIRRGRVEARRRIGLSTSFASTAAVGIGDDGGEYVFENVAAAGGLIGTLFGRVLDEQTVFLTEDAAFSRCDCTIVDFNVFSREANWWDPRRRNGATRILVRDALGTGPVRNAAVISGDVPGEGFVRLTPDDGSASAGLGDLGQATASIATGATGFTVVSAFTVVEPDSTRVELPVERARPAPQPAHLRHGLISGNINGVLPATSNRSRRALATRRLALQDFFDASFLGGSTADAVPVRLAPDAAPVDRFELGVPAPRGHLVVAEGTTGPRGTGTAFTLETLGLLLNVEPPQGGRSELDLPLRIPVNTSYSAPDALTNLDSSIVPGDLQLDLGAVLGDGRIVELCRDVGGNHQWSGSNVTFRLPPNRDPGGRELDGAEYLVGFGGSGERGGRTIDQRVFMRFRDRVDPFVRFLAVPEIVSPAPDELVPLSGFTLRYTVPVSTAYLVVTLESTTAEDRLVWRAVLPPSVDSFRFRELDKEAATPLRTQREYRLTVTAARIESGPLLGTPDRYRRMVQNWVGIGEAERQVNAFSSSSITIQTQ